jgi:class 3 adenylate cyclase/tetratricopeptide (TPR) repeat protein
MSADAVPCQVCGSGNQPGARFCSACGTPFAPPAGRERERRIVTILFADVSGSTSLAEQVDPEDWAEVLDGLFPIMNAAVARYGGTVARLMGDAILAFFGAPVAHEDDPERAVRAGLELLRDAAAYRARVLERLAELGVEPGRNDLAVRVGINTGEVVVGDVGSEVRAEYTALGDAVNVAARMEQTAEPGTVRISADTLARVGHLVRAEPLGPITVKGKAQPIEAFRVVGVEDAGDHGSALSGESPLVGRESELARLAEAMDRLRVGRSTIVVLLGEPGIGKSRLVAEARAAAGETEPALRWIEEACPSFESMRPYALATRLAADLTAASAHAPGAGAERTRLEEAMADLARPSPTADPDIVRSRFFSAAAALLEELARADEARPVVVALDDLHWADAASADLVTALFEVSERAPLLFLCAGRPDRDGPAWRLKLHADTHHPHRTVTLDLAPLDDAEAAGLVEGLLTVADLPPGLVEAVVARSDGNPYFVEELIREMTQTGAIAQLAGGEWTVPDPGATSILPDSLQTLLRSRIDRLKPGPRAVLEVAAVVGRSFERALLEAVTASPDLDRDLAALLQVGLVVEGDGSPRTFAFRHGLTQDAAYRSIGRKRRRRVHLAVAEALERFHPEELGQWAPLLAHHFGEAVDALKTVEYRLVAAESAEAMAAFADAAGHFDRGLAAAAGEDVPVDSRIRLHLGRGRVRDRTGDFEGALADLESARGLSERHGEARLTWESEAALGELWASRDYRRTGEHYRRALEMARSSTDSAMLASSLNRLGNWYVNSADPAKGIELHREALGIVRRSGDQPAVAATLDLMGMAHAISGDLTGALAHYREALEAFRALDDRAGLASTLVSLALASPSYELVAHPPLMSIAEALPGVAEAVELTVSIGWRTGEAYARFIRAQLLGSGGRLGEGLEEAERALDLARELGHRQWEAGSLLAVGSLLWDAMAYQRCVPVFEQALVAAEEVDSLFWIINCSAALSLGLTSAGERTRARDVAMAVLGRPGVHAYGPRANCLLALAVAHRGLGERDRAWELLDELVPAGSPIVPAVSLERGRILADEDTESAGGHLRAGLAVSEATGHWSMRWRIHRELASLPGADPAHAGAVHDLVESAASTLPPDLAECLRRGAGVTGSG